MGITSETQPIQRFETEMLSTEMPLVGKLIDRRNFAEF